MSDDENPFRRQRHIYNDWWIIEWMPYILIALFFVGLVFFMTWCGAMENEDCREHGGDHMLRTGRYHSICVSKDGRIVEW